ncbi:hypothetical protein, partial [Arenimonas oryziterrae]|uniref:hypothetical protein n=1 Tax=Arenimonas oryziterrae TaxID=498055 RepID=UPI001B806585
QTSAVRWNDLLGATITARAIFLFPIDLRKALQTNAPASENATTNYYPNDEPSNDVTSLYPIGRHGGSANHVSNAKNNHK